jgi:ribonucleoside-diphosphate reductase alpha chain
VNPLSNDIDPDLTENSIKVLGERYLQKNEAGEIIETPRQLFERVARGVAAAEDMGDNLTAFPGGIKAAQEAFYGMMARREFMPNTPTLVNAGRPEGSSQLSACFVIPVPDSMEGIFDAVKSMALIHKTGGGTGFSFTRLRPQGSFVKGSTGIASGPLSFMRVFDDATRHILQGGVRRGANMGIMRVNHPDIEEFIRIKADDESAMQNFNLSVGITDEFMIAVERGDYFALRDPRDGKKVRDINPRWLWSLIIECAHKIGDPGLFFIDKANEADPLSHLPGMEIEATNPCGEVPLRPWDACTLGSINLERFVVYKGLSFDYVRLEAAVRLAVRFLDNVLTVNKYPRVEIHEATKASRKIGLGVMGWADALVHLEIPYDSDAARHLAEAVMSFINAAARRASADLAVERGPYPLWERSKERARGLTAVRNSTRTVIAPTGTISIIAGCSSGIEPLYALSMTRKQAGMTMTEVHPIVGAIIAARGDVKIRLWKHIRDYIDSNGRLPIDAPEDLRRLLATANEISVDGHIQMQAAFQRYTDDAVSKTINMRKDVSPDDIEAAYLQAYKAGCKGITVYRDGCRGVQVLTAGTKPKETAATFADAERAIAQLAVDYPDPPRPPIDFAKLSRDKLLHTKMIGVAEVSPLLDASFHNGIEEGERKARERLAVLEVSPQKPDRRRIPADGRRSGMTISRETPYGTVHVTINNHPDDGQPFEVFVSMGKAGSEVKAWTEAFGRILSYLLSISSSLTPTQRLDAVAQQLGLIGGGGQIGLGSERVVSAPDAISKVLNSFLYDGTAGAVPTTPTRIMSKDMCPACGVVELVPEEGCKKCHACGYSQC